MGRSQAHWNRFNPTSSTRQTFNLKTVVRSLLRLSLLSAKYSCFQFWDVLLKHRLHILDNFHHHILKHTVHCYLSNVCQCDVNLHRSRRANTSTEHIVNYWSVYFITSDAFILTWPTRSGPSGFTRSNTGQSEAKRSGHLSKGTS